MKLLLHVGMPKTGTSFLQKEFVKNSNVFQENGIVYPGINQKSKSYTCQADIPINGALITRCFKDYFHIHKDINRCHQVINEELKKLIDLEYDTVFISGETIGVLPKVTFDVLYSEAKKLNICIEPILFVRNPVNAIPSSWSQRVRMHGETRDLELFTNEQHIPSYHNALYIKEIFSTVHIYSYDDQMLNGGLLSIFENILGLSPAILTDKSNYEVVNKSLSYPVLQTMCQMNDKLGQEFTKLFEKKMLQDIYDIQYHKIPVSSQLKKLIEKKYNHLYLRVLDRH